MNNSVLEMIAQKLFVGIPNKKSIPGVIELIKKYHIGGVILYKNNYDSLDDMIALINKLKKANESYDIPLAIAIDQEGGRVNRLPKEFHNIKSAYRLNKSGIKAVKDSSYMISNILKMLGINMNFAPVLDIRSQSDDNAFIGNRAYSENVEEIQSCRKEFVKEHEKNSVIPVCKHYPGHGNLNVDSHIFLPIIKKFSKEYNGLAPFKELNDIPALMISHILINGYTNYKPASLSNNFIKNFLKGENQYKGLIVTDELGMSAVRIFYGKYKSINLAYEAGNDIICCKYEDNYISKLLKQLLNNPKIKEEELKESFNKIISYKNKYKFDDRKIINNINIEDINKQIDEINNMKEI